MFPAHSPQAKGRIERLWATIQSRLPIELALQGITSVSEANAFLPLFIERFNEQFSVEAKDSFSAFVPVPHTTDLNRLLCVEFYRKLGSGSTISLDHNVFMIDQNKFQSKTPVTLLLSEKHGLRALINGEFYPIRPFADDSVLAAVHAPKVVMELIERFLLRDAKAA